MNNNSVPLIRASQILPALDLMDKIGAPRETYLRKAKLPLLVYDDAEAVLPELFYLDMVDQVAYHEGIEDFGLQVATNTPLWKSEPELVGFLQSLPTLWIAMTTFCRLAKQFTTLVHFSIMRHGKFAHLQRCQKLGFSGEDQAEIYDIMILTQLLQLAGGRDWFPTEVIVSKVTARRLARIKTFEQVVIRTDENIASVIFPADMLGLPMNAIANPVGSELPAPLTVNFLESISAVIGSYLQDGSMNINLAAEMAGLTKRTFQRRLGDLQLDYNTLIDRERLRIAMSMLVTPDKPVTEIAFDLGYSDAAHFTRAFRRWTALCPREYRQQHQLA